MAAWLRLGCRGLRGLKGTLVVVVEGLWKIIRFAVKLPILFFDVPYLFAVLTSWSIVVVAARGISWVPVVVVIRLGRHHCTRF